MANEQKILITGGHMTPAFAVIEELQKRGFHDFVWVGHKFNQATTKNPSAEYKIVNDMGIRFVQLRAGKFMWVITPSNWRFVIRDWFLTPYGFWRARQILRQEQPDIVISFGGYLALPIVYQAKKMGIATVTHEQTLTQGRANRWISKFVDLVLVSWKQTMDIYPADKAIFTGNPIRKSTLEVRSDSYHFPDNGLPWLYITGGNQGSYNMSRRIFSILPELLKKFNIIHQTGDSTEKQTYEKSLYIRSQLPFELRYRYQPRPFIFDDEIGEVYHKSDIVFGRSGANTITELAALGKLGVFMPINWASGNEQRKNAEMLEAVGLGLICKQTDDPNEPQRVIEHLQAAKEAWEKKIGFNGEPIADCGKAALELINLDAASAIADVVTEIVTSTTS